MSVPLKTLKECIANNSVKYLVINGYTERRVKALCRIFKVKYSKIRYKHIIKLGAPFSVMSVNNNISDEVFYTARHIATGMYKIRTKHNNFINMCKQAIKEGVLI